MKIPVKAFRCNNKREGVVMGKNVRVVLQRSVRSMLYGVAMLVCARTISCIVWGCNLKSMLIEDIIALCIAFPIIVLFNYITLDRKK